VYLGGAGDIHYDGEARAGGVGFPIPVSVAGQADVDYSYTNMQDLGGVHRISVPFMS
jgi:hypothetical protein